MPPDPPRRLRPIAADQLSHTQKEKIPRKILEKISCMKPCIACLLTPNVCMVVFSNTMPAGSVPLA